MHLTIRGIVWNVDGQKVGSKKRQCVSNPPTELAIHTFFAMEKTAADRTLVGMLVPIQPISVISPILPCPSLKTGLLDQA